MGTEHCRDQKQGRSWIGSFVISAIDQSLRSRLPGECESPESHCVKLIDMIIAPLILEKVPYETLEHLKVEFVPPKKNLETNRKLSQDLMHIGDVLSAEFGCEVVKRLRLSLSENKIRSLPHNYN